MNGIASIIVGVYFTGVFVHPFTNAAIPLTAQGGWRGVADVIYERVTLLPGDRGGPVV